jgi:hypothetical protein
VLLLLQHCLRRLGVHVTAFAALSAALGCVSLLLHYCLLRLGVRHSCSIVCGAWVRVAPTAALCRAVTVIVALVADADAALLAATAGAALCPAAAAGAALVVQYCVQVMRVQHRRCCCGSSIVCGCWRCSSVFLLRVLAQHCLRLVLHCLVVRLLPEQHSLRFCCRMVCYYHYRCNMVSCYCCCCWRSFVCCCCCMCSIIVFYCCCLRSFGCWYLTSASARQSVLGNLLVQYCLVQQHRWRGCWCSIVWCSSIDGEAAGAVLFAAASAGAALFAAGALGVFRLCLRVQLRYSFAISRG